MTDRIPLGWLLVALFFEIEYLLWPMGFPFPFPGRHAWYTLWQWLR